MNLSTLPRKLRVRQRRGVEAGCVKTDPPRSSFSVTALHDVVFGPRLAEAEGPRQRLAGVVILRLACGDDPDRFPTRDAGSRI